MFVHLHGVTYLSYEYANMQYNKHKHKQKYNVYATYIVV